MQDLTGKGLSKELLLPIIEELYAEESGDIEFDQIKVLLEKKHYDPGSIDYKEKQKIMAFLMRRGFQISTIRKAMDWCEE